MWYIITMAKLPAKQVICCAVLVLILTGHAGVQAQPSPAASDLISEVRSTALPLSGYTWIIFSTPEKLEALKQQRHFRENGMTGNVIEAEVDRQVFYRIAVGQYNSRREASLARNQLRQALPEDAWLFRMTAGTRLVSETEWLPVRLQGPRETMSYLDDALMNDEPVVADDALQTDKDPDEEHPEEHVLSVDTDLEGDAPADTAPAGTPFGTFMNRHFSAALQFSSIFEDNIEHDADVDAIQSYGMVPSLHVRFHSGGEDRIFTLEYLVARHAYSNTERWDRVSNAFRAAFESELTDALHLQTSAELSLRGSSEDRDVSNQFQVVQEIEYRFTRRHRLQLYGTYRVKRFPDQPGVRDLKPNVGLNFERRNSDGERFETGARYEVNREEEIRGNYNRWTFDVEYRTPEFNRGRDQFEVGVKHRRKKYEARFVELDDEDYLREDNRLSIDAIWIHHFNRGVSTELGYEFETRGSNDPERLYEANAFRFVMTYAL